MKKAVIDLGFGDSGKGTFTAYLCSISKDPLVIRFSGDIKQDIL
jgi:adenylosuccinate synthase